MVFEETIKSVRTMAKSKRKRTTKTLRYFYLNEELHKTLLVKRPDDLIIAWNYQQDKRVAYVLSDCRQRMQRAYSAIEVSRIIGRDRLTILKYIYAGHIAAPQKAQVIGGSEREGRYFFSEQDIYRLHDYLLTVSIGRPRKDGERRATNAPSRRELEAILKNNTVLYVKGNDGEFTPIWKQPDW